MHTAVAYKSPREFVADKLNNDTFVAQNLEDTPEGATIQRLVAGPNFPSKFDFASLESWAKAQNRENVNALVHTMALVPAQVLARNIGSEAVLWSFSRDYLPDSELASDRKKYFAAAGYRFDDLSVAVRGAAVIRRLLAERSEISPATIEQGYQLSHKFSSGKLVLPSVVSLIKSNKRPEFSFGTRKMARYELSMFTLENEESPAGYLESWSLRDFNFDEQGSSSLSQQLKSGQEYKKRYKETYTDAPFGFLVLFDGEPQAILSFVPSGERLIICQLQTLKANLFLNGRKVFDAAGKEIRIGSRGLMGLNATHLLIDLGIQFAERNGFQKVGIICSQMSHWAQTAPVEELPKFKAIYDQAPEAKGFTKSSSGLWERDLLTR